MKNKENKNQCVRWVEQHPQKFKIEERIFDYEYPIRGIYGIFVRNENDGQEKCAYVGRSYNIYSRMFMSKGHLVRLMCGDHPSRKLTQALENDNEIIVVKVLEPVPIDITGDYYKEMQKLASRENYYIDKYQELDQCLEQVPEGTPISKDEWDSMKENQQKQP